MTLRAVDIIGFAVCLFLIAFMVFLFFIHKSSSEGECRWRGAMVCRENWNPPIIHLPHQQFGEPS